MREKINITGLVFTEDNVDDITNKIVGYLNEYPTAQLIFSNGNEFLDFLQAESFGDIDTGGFYSVLDDSEITIDGWNMEDIPFIYILPIKRPLSLFSTAYEDYGELVREFERRLRQYEEFLPDDFNIKDHIAHIWGYANIIDFN